MSVFLFNLALDVIKRIFDVLTICEEVKQRLKKVKFPTGMLSAGIESVGIILHKSPYESNELNYILGVQCIVLTFKTVASIMIGHNIFIKLYLVHCRPRCSNHKFHQERRCSIPLISWDNILRIQFCWQSRLQIRIRWWKNEGSVIWSSFFLQIVGCSMERLYIF